MDVTVMMRIFVFLLSVTTVLSQKENPSVVIIGTGASGIAAASKLIQNGINNIKIFEAEGRLGGRVYSTKCGDDMVDMGGQWVHGEKDNVVYELAWPLGLLSHARNKGEDESKPVNLTLEFFGSSGERITAKTSNEIYKILVNLTSQWPDIETSKNGSIGEYLQEKFDSIFYNYTEISTTMRKPLMDLLHLMQMASDGGEDWNKVSAKGVIDYKCCEGNKMINWKEKTYSTIFDILMKKYPKPEEEIPVMDKIMFTKKVIKIQYGDDGPVKLKTADGNDYETHHVIFTPSLGVLQANYENLFEPSLSSTKINSIKNIGMGHNGKIYLYYDEPWWLTGENTYAKALFWTADDRKALENDVRMLIQDELKSGTQYFANISETAQKRWMLSVFIAVSVEYKPHLLCLWLAGPNIKEMETLPDELVKNQTAWLLNKFFSHLYNVTSFKEMKRSDWNSNENFLGSYSYRSIQSDKQNATAEDIGEPIMRGDKPIIMFAGEATSSDKYGTVNGAIETGWREADRLINLYKKKKEN